MPSSPLRGPDVDPERGEPPVPDRDAL